MERKFKLDSHPHAFCYVQINDDYPDSPEVSLISYETNVLTLYKGKNKYWLTCNGNYSMSTIKHIGWFLDEFHTMVSYQEIKAKLIEAAKANRTLFELGRKPIEFITIDFADVSENDIPFDRVVKRYLESGEPFKKYAKEPNYDYRFYGNSRFSGIVLP